MAPKDWACSRRRNVNDTAQQSSIVECHQDADIAPMSLPRHVDIMVIL